jgi:hypothetical protein
MPPQDDQMLISYRELRRAIGLIGIALPIVLIIGGQNWGEPKILDSISSYYYSASMRNVLVGSLCAIGVFLGSYRGDKRWDNLAGNLACAFAIGVAMFPCSEAGKDRTWYNYVHYGAAAGLFLVFAYFCLYSFTGMDPGTTKTPKKPLRNGIYVTCGIVILACMAGMAVIGFFPPEHQIKNFVFVLEWACVWAFGWPFYIKGKGLGIVQG